MKNLILLLTALCIVSCADEEYGSLYEMFPAERELTLSSEVVISEPLPQWGSGFIYGSQLFMELRQGSAKHNTVAIDVNSGEVLSKFIPKGRGRNESLWTMLKGMDGDSIVCFDANKDMILKAHIDELSKPTGDQTWSRKELEWSGTAFAQEWYWEMLSSDRYIFNHTLEDTLFEVTDSSFEPLHRFGDREKLKGTDEEISAALAGLFIVSPSRERVLYYTSLGNFIYLLDTSSESDEPKVLKSYLFDTPKVEIKHFDGRGIGVFQDDNCALGTMSSAVSSDHFYLLHTDKTLAEIRASDSVKFESDTVLVFDHDGEPVERLKLDREVTSIFYSEAEGALYSVGYNDDEDNVLLKYKL